VLLDDPGAAAKLLTAAPGLGWSRFEHPGHLLFSLYAALLGVEPLHRSLGPDQLPDRGMELEEREWRAADPDKTRLATPELWEVVALAEVDRPLKPGDQHVVIGALRKAAEKRLLGVTEHKRRRYYGHGAELVATCAALDSTPGGLAWVAGIRDTYHRYPALRRELDRCVGA